MFSEKAFLDLLDMSTLGIMCVLRIVELVVDRRAENTYAKLDRSQIRDERSAEIDMQDIGSRCQCNTRFVVVGASQC